MKVLSIEVAPYNAAMRAVIALTAREQRAYLTTEQVVCYGLILTAAAALAQSGRDDEESMSTWSWPYGPLPQAFEAQLRRAAVDHLVRLDDDEGRFAFKQQVWHSVTRHFPMFEPKHLPLIDSPRRFLDELETGAPSPRAARARAHLKLVKGTP